MPSPRSRSSGPVRSKPKSAAMNGAATLHDHRLAVRSSASRATLSGFSAGLVGIGLARFAYTPLLPAIIDAHWFAPNVATYLGAANLAGYLAGAVLERRISRRVPAALAVK